MQAIFQVDLILCYISNQHVGLVLDPLLLSEICPDFFILQSGCCLHPNDTMFGITEGIISPSNKFIIYMSYKVNQLF